MEIAAEYCEGPWTLPRCSARKTKFVHPSTAACSASPELRVIYLVIVEQDQTQAHRSSSTRGSSKPLDHSSHVPRIVRPRCCTESFWLRAGRKWACTRPLRSVHATAKLVCRGRVVIFVSYVMSAAAGRVILCNIN